MFKISIREIKGHGAYCMMCTKRIMKERLELYKRDPENYDPSVIEKKFISPGTKACHIILKDSSGCLCLECAKKIFAELAERL